MKPGRVRPFPYVSLLPVLVVATVISGCASIPPPHPATIVVSGVGIGYVMMQSHKRTFKKYWNDNQLDRAITREIKKDRQLTTTAKSVTHVNVTVFNGVVLLTGEVPLQNQIARIIDIASSYAASRQLINRI